MAGDAGGVGVIVFKWLIKNELTAGSGWADVAIAAVVVGRQMLGVFCLGVELRIAPVMASHAVRAGARVVKEGAFPIHEIGLSMASGAVIGLIGNVTDDLALGGWTLAVVAGVAAGQTPGELMVPLRTQPSGE